MERKRELYSVDVLRFIACISVVVIHYGKNWPLEQEIHAIAMYAVPLFYIISGYFLYAQTDEDSTKRIKKSIKRIGKLFFISGMILFFVNIIYFMISGQDFWGMLTLKNVIIRFVVLDDWFFPIGGPLWFLQALFYGYWVIWILIIMRLYRYKTLVACICLILNAIFTEFYGLLDMWRYVPEGIVGGNFLFRAVPFLIIGLLIHENYDKVNNMNVSVPIIFIIIGILATVGELKFLDVLGALKYEGYFQGNMFLAIGLFWGFIKYPYFGEGSLFCKIGKENSLGIYLIHQPVGFILEELFPSLKKSCFLCFIIFFVSLFLSVLYKRIRLIFSRLIKVS